MCYSVIMQITVVLHNIRSTYNVGAILRTAEGLGIKKVIYSGYTPRYEDTELLPHLRAKLNHQIAKAALGAEKLVTQESIGKSDSQLTTWLQVVRKSATVVGLENNLSPEELPRQLILGQPYPASVKTALHSEVVLVLGEEVNGIPATIRAQMDYFLEIPMQGRKESFNVSVATGIALWGLLHCS